MKLRSTVSLLLVAVGCGGGSPSATPTPSVQVRTLAATDPELSALAKAAARSLEPGTDGKVRFGGVYVAGRQLSALSDTVTRLIGATRVDMYDGRVPYTIGRAGEGAVVRFTNYALTMFRVTGDTAYVGVDATGTGEPEGARCIVLTRSGIGWVVSKTSIATNPRSCGAKR